MSQQSLMDLLFVLSDFFGLVDQKDCLCVLPFLGALARSQVTAPVASQDLQELFSVQRYICTAGGFQEAACI